MAGEVDDKSFKCNFCALKLENYHFLSQHLHQFHNIALMQCDYCTMEFPNKKELADHMNSRHHGKTLIECSICPSTFISVKGLLLHVNKMHEKHNEVFQCKVCKKKYKFRSSLLKHTKVAHRPLSYLKCDQCTKIFVSRDTLKVHQATEHKMNNKRVQCMICATTYKYRSQLRRHELEVHFRGQKKKPGATSGIRCNICSVCYVNKTELLKHRKQEHNKAVEIFTCEMCPAVFKLREAFEAHLWDEHGLVNEDQEEVPDENYVVEDFVDFELTMMQDYELRQLMKIRKDRKFFQKLIIVTYSDKEAEDITELDIDESDLEHVLCHINGFFRSIVGQQLDKGKPVQTRSNLNQSAFLEVQITEDESTDTFCDNIANANETSTEATALNCNECEEKFNNEDNLNEHVKNVHNNISERDDKIDEESASKSDSDVTEPKEIDNISSRLRRSQNKSELIPKLATNLMDNAKCSTSKSKLQCDNCKKNFRTKRVFLKHLTECKDKVNIMYPCEFCKALFPCSELLLNHCAWQHKT